MPAPVNTFKAALKEGRQTIGCWLTQGTAVAAEIAATCDYDWLLIDGEHSPNDIPSMLAQLQALAGYEAPALIRPPIGETRIIKQVLDIGCQTLIVPMVESGDQAEMLVQAMRYPPLGVRGVGATGARASRFSGIVDYAKTANDQMCLVAQVESRAGLEALDDIMAFIGPADLSADMGHIGNPSAPEVVAAIDDALTRIEASGKASGIMALDPVAVRSYLARGVTFVAAAIDSVTLARGLRANAVACREG